MTPRSSAPRRPLVVAGLALLTLAAQAGRAQAAPTADPAPQPEQQTILVTIPPGVLTVSTPYTPGHPLHLGSLRLTPGGDELRASATFSEIAVIDSRSGGYGWRVEVRADPMSDADGDLVNAQNLGLADIETDPVPDNALPGPIGNVATFDSPPAAPAVGPDAAGDLGLSGPHLLATATAGVGRIAFHGTLVMVAPTSTPPGHYTGTVTITVY